MEIRFSKPAQQELDEAVDYYNNESPGLGEQLLVDVLHTLDRIRDYPEAWQAFSNTTRRCRTRKFPYGIVYRLREQEIQVIAVMHMHRDPSYWFDRDK